jgi:hypothetical protein
MNEHSVLEDCEKNHVSDTFKISLKDEHYEEEKGDNNKIENEIEEIKMSTNGNNEIDDNSNEVQEEYNFDGICTSNSKG